MCEIRRMTRIAASLLFLFALACGDDDRPGDTGTDATPSGDAGMCVMRGADCTTSTCCEGLACVTMGGGGIGGPDGGIIMFETSRCQ